MATHENAYANWMERMHNEDAADHFSCDKKNLLAYLYAVQAPTDLLFAKALEDTGTIAESCYTKKQYRWNFKTKYFNEKDWSSIGVHTLRTDEKFDFDRFVELAEFEIGNGRPIMFEAPKCGIPYFLALMKQYKTPTEEYDMNHCYMLLNVSREKDQLAFFDVYHGIGGIHYSSLAETRQRYTETSRLWFYDCYAVDYRVSQLDLNAFYQTHREFLLSNYDELSLYQMIADMLPYEISETLLTYQVSSVNAVSLLYGSRLMFSRFLKTIGYPEDLVKRYAELVHNLSTIQKRVNVLFSQIELNNRSNANRFIIEIKRRLNEAFLQERSLNASLVNTINSYPSQESLEGASSYA